MHPLTHLAIKGVMSAPLVHIHKIHIGRKAIQNLLISIDYINVDSDYSPMSRHGFFFFI